MVGEEKRHQMMQNLFGDQSEEEEEEVESEHESNRQPDYVSHLQPPHPLKSQAQMYQMGDGLGDILVAEALTMGKDEGDVGLKPEGEDVVEGQGEAEVSSDTDGELHEMDQDHIESEGERDQSSQEVDLGDQREESEGKDSGSDQLGQRVVTSRRREVVESESERSEENHYLDNADEEIDQARSPRSPDEEKDEAHAQTAPELRDVFGESDDEEPAEYDAVQNHLEDDANRSPMEDEGYEKNLRPEDVLADEEGRYDSEEENVIKAKEKPVGPPLELGIPLRPPPSHPEKMNVIKVSNIMGIDPKPFDPKTFVEEDAFVADESGHSKRIRLENNIVRYRAVRNADGTTSYESNARFVRWSDGSLQLLIGNEVLDISVQDAQHDQAHLFLRHEKVSGVASMGILQSQGRVLKKMRFMPSSLTSNSHRLLTALVDSRHKKVFRVKKTVTDIDPEREKEQKEKAESQTIRANELLSRKKEKVNRKYTTTVRRERQLSPGFLEDALDEDDEQDYYDNRRSRRRFDEDLEMEARAEKRIINAKKSQGHKDTPRKSSLNAIKSSRRPVDDYESEREESEYETEGEEDERSPPRRRAEEPERYDDEDEEEQYEEALADEASEEETEFKHKSSGGSLKRQEIESDEESPPRKAATSHRRKALVYDSDEE
ncbi:Leo1-like protein [Cynara cardunculus var. scolymus]|uniref:Leo1-like protein n=1 Tax=Cynara cardunculus var. scolymus TaxID=59895 RepID=A0A103XYL9_CYNCS|nr:Leo1-like protein [Cynara cardunculus var. scolymus]